MNIPRILLAAPKSGSGKTLITCALLGALKSAGKNVMAYKCGPDYIDPMFHRTVQKIPCENLDSFFLGDDKVPKFLAETFEDRDIAVIEGVMGLFDGMSVENDKGSAYDIARLTKTPIILIVDAHGMSRSIIPFIKGFLDFDDEKLIKGIILNQVTSMFFGMIRPVLEKEIEIPVIGYFPKRTDLNLESRHLGLKLPEEVDGLNAQLQEAARQFEETIGIESILKIAGEASHVEAEPAHDNCVLTRQVESLQAGNPAVSAISKKPGCGDGKPEGNESTASNLTLAVARDEAFCFYYGANIRLFEKMGVKIRYFSPLHDKELPKEANGILLGGGYPELYAKELSENVSMRNSVKAAIESGMPSLAECGGFMYLHEKIRDLDNCEYEMVGAVRGSCENKGKLVRFGYINLQEKSENFLKAGSVIRAHEFHYYDSTDNGSSCVAKKPSGSRSWECIHEGDNHFWGFPHLYYESDPDFVMNFINRMK